MQPTDLETVKAMLDRARIPYKHDKVDDVSETGHSAALPDGSEVVSVAGNFTYGGEDGGVEQPYPGGYPGFWSELYFDADGALIAVWAWE